MNKVCSICGHAGENVWRDGKYYCAICGAEIDVTGPSAPSPAPETAYAGGTVPVDVTCPICRNANNNVLQNGKCRCALCGTAFDMPRQSYDYQSGSNYQYDYYGSSSVQRREELKKQRDKKVVWGIVWLLLFWPVGVYFFYKAYQLTQEMNRLGH